MRNLCLVLWCCGIVLMVGGCQSANRGMEVILPDGVEFPEQIAGVWKSNDPRSSWALQFEKNGTISWCVVPLGAVKMTPGKVTTLPARHGGQGIFTPGKWTVQYDPQSRELSAEIAIKHFHLDTGPDSAIEGSRTALLIGAVSPDYRVWEVDWFSKEVLVLLVAEPKKFADSKEYKFRRKVVLEKQE